MIDRDERISETITVDKVKRERFFIKNENNVYRDVRRKKPLCCHAYINNIAFPKSLEEIKAICTNEQGKFDIEILLSSKEIFWTAPRWAMAGDICFFMHAKNANITISALKTELRANSDEYSKSDYEDILSSLMRGKQLHKTYGGKIFAVARVLDSPVTDSDDERIIHWKTPLYAQMGEIWFLKEPVDISVFKRYITLSSRGAITPVYGKQFEQLRNLILENNQDPPEYLRSSIAGDAETSRINKDNWIRVAGEYRHSFIYEKQLRYYYVDYFLSALGDIKTIYSECKCVKFGITDSSHADNVIKFHGRYLPVEVKLVFPDKAKLIGQVTKYCNDDIVFLDKEEKRGIRTEYLYHNHVLLIDRDKICLYAERTKYITEIYSFDNLRNYSDIELIKTRLASILLPEYSPLEKIHKLSRRKKNFSEKQIFTNL